jgi:transposase-like protein
MSMNEPRKYEREFKLNTVKLYIESGKSLSKLSQDLGVPMATLAKWVKQFKETGENSFPGSGKLMPQNEELFRLRQELADVKQERDILKKAVAIFSRTKG